MVSQRRTKLTALHLRQRLVRCRQRQTWVVKWHQVVFTKKSLCCQEEDFFRIRSKTVTYRTRVQKTPLAVAVYNKIVNDRPAHGDDGRRLTTVHFFLRPHDAQSNNEEVSSHSFLSIVSSIPWTSVPKINCFISVSVLPSANPYSAHVGVQHPFPFIARGCPTRRSARVIRNHQGHVIC
ncbi:hypothetical protein TNCV_3118051 [Trichonephila clavipes]|uniref:Uncharacterized protein n=1 Tax=Trichonephila clavipes TaxID=2585209 RepID=A0A8X6W994_TRICX|nr:hypothetical protein TNCV_3118051 [Trichonephila clavipes]